jgi:hypothetical protein
MSSRRLAIHLPCAAIVVIGMLLSQTISLNAHKEPRGSRFVTMEVSVREDVALRLAAKEGEAATLEHPDIGKFEFKPSFKKGADAFVVVAIFDASVSPPRRLGEVTVPADGKQRVESKTSPNFRIRIVRVVETEK